jgi:hypothetical protein
MSRAALVLVMVVGCGGSAFESSPGIQEHDAATTDVLLDVASEPASADAAAEADHPVPVNDAGPEREGAAEVDGAPLVDAGPDAVDAGSDAVDLDAGACTPTNITACVVTPACEASQRWVLCCHPDGTCGCKIAVGLACTP